MRPDVEIGPDPAEEPVRARVRPQPPVDLDDGRADAPLPLGPNLDGPNRDPDPDRIGDITGGTREIRTGRRASLRREFKEVRRTHVVSLIVLVLVLLGAPLAFYTVREATNDPVFGHLSGLAVPTWAARDPRDETTGNRWCIGECQLRQRILRSERNPEETSAAYATALRKAGWAEWKIDGCPSTDQGGVETCWQRDEYVLDLWVYQPDCEVQLKVPDPSRPATPLAEAVCPPTVVTLQVINKVSYDSKG